MPLTWRKNRTVSKTGIQKSTSVEIHFAIARKSYGIPNHYQLISTEANNVGSIYWISSESRLNIDVSQRKSFTSHSERYTDSNSGEKSDWVIYSHRIANHNSLSRAVISGRCHWSYTIVCGWTETGPPFMWDNHSPSQLKLNKEACPFDTAC